MKRLRELIQAIMITNLSFVGSLAYGSTTYGLRGYGFGTAGVSGSASTTYKAEGSMGELGSSRSSSSSYKTKDSYIGTVQAHVPAAPTATNPASYYNKLHVVVSTSNNPSDTTFVIAASSDNFVSDTRYVQSDFTLGAAVGSEDRLTYTGWGNTSGIDVTGLNPSTTYYFKVSAMQGDFTETEFGPVDSADTIAPSLSFDIDVAATDTETASPYNVALGTLTVDTVITATDKVWTDFETNAASGGGVYVSDSNSGLNSAGANHTITSASVDLGGAAEGYGLQIASVSQSSGGPLAKVSPYDQAGDTVGLLSTTVRQILSTTSPITAGRASIYVKAVSQSTTPSASDYEDTLTFTATASF